MNDDTPLPSPSLHPPPAHVAAGGLAQPATDHYIDTLTTDEHIMSLVHAVIDINKHLLIEPTQDRLFRLFEADQERAHTYYTQLLDYCYHAPANIEALNLDQLDDMTFKCLGTSIYAFTRQIPTESEAETASAFKKILMDVVMQGGDAGTNAAVAGALLGVRIGYDQLPSDWVIGLKRWEWLEDRVEEFCHLL
ncbi:hypothetical protein BDB00DRAFT_22930 [Zychaea mexicana]|uniref:uncharacterized protein n=1 Tax=Zychaea mexicana TaxID=64656 RepID=UPI0022FE565A|nr:uncharacterized protein BDB00DRAFT_22930 [Zychaea mexicana]KAI9497284.1 hypothetical protein BDB00DRAFT_22930 [Zychaea mexicana]